MLKRHLTTGQVIIELQSICGIILILNFAKNALKQTKIYGCHAVENVNSGKVMIKNGFVPTGYTTVTNFDGTTKKARTYILNF